MRKEFHRINYKDLSNETHVEYHEAWILFSPETAVLFAPMVAEINAVTDRYKALMAHHRK